MVSNFQWCKYLPYGASHASNASAFVFRTSTTERLRITVSLEMSALEIMIQAHYYMYQVVIMVQSVLVEITQDLQVQQLLTTIPSFTTTTIPQNYRAINGNALLDIDTGTFTVSTGTSGTERFRIDAYLVGLVSDL